MCGKLLLIEVMSPSLVEYNFITVLIKYGSRNFVPILLLRKKTDK